VESSDIVVTLNPIVDQFRCSALLASAATSLSERRCPA